MPISLCIWGVWGRENLRKALGGEGGERKRITKVGSEKTPLWNIRSQNSFKYANHELTT